MPVYGGIGSKVAPEYVQPPQPSNEPLPQRTPAAFNKYAEEGTWSGAVHDLWGDHLPARVVASLADRHGYTVPDLKNEGVVRTDGSADHAQFFHYVFGGD